MSDIEVQEYEEAQRQAAIEAAMKADGVPTEDRRQQSYFGFTETHKFMLPDGVSFILHQALNEGARKAYQNAINREVAIKRSSGDAVMKMATGDEKHQLMIQAIVGWNLVDENGVDIPFQKGSQQNGRTTRSGTLDKFLDEASPTIIDMIYKDIQKHNPWLMAEMTAQDIKDQIKDLQDMLDVKEKEEAAKNS